MLDKNISAPAKVIFGILTSKADGWKFSKEEILRNLKEDSVDLEEVIKELEDSKYIKKAQVFKDEIYLMSA